MLMRVPVEKWAESTVDLPLHYNKFQVNLKVKPQMKIGELSQKTGLPASTIRYYEGLGLLPPARRGQNGYRDYDDEALRRLNAVRASQSLGFTLEAIRGFFNGDGPCQYERVLAQIAVRAREMEEEQAALDAQRRNLDAMRSMVERRIGGEPRGQCPGR
jgi:DNA-binding transcriptional MerR regulator